MSPGQQQEGERGLNLLASCGEAKAVRLNSIQRSGSRVHPSVLAVSLLTAAAPQEAKPGLSTPGAGMWHVYTPGIFMDLPWGDTARRIQLFTMGHSHSLETPFTLCCVQSNHLQEASSVKKDRMRRMITINLPVIVCMR